ncbi:hypothetical protein ACTXJR_17975 [Glutamicibacter ardleyensis]|uniref:hypothetical protein n=1 Tax=Glutamicibacter ardleyensis TaxID=225894 RepID=UPI003FD5480A
MTDNNVEMPCFICHNRERARHWHSTEISYLDRAECRAAVQVEGIWLCSVCEESVHRWMKENKDVEKSSNQGVIVMIERLNNAIYQPRKTRRRNTDTPGGHES